jgi:hypothetical protein
VFYKISSFSKLKRIIAYCLRFIDNCKNKSRRNRGNLNGAEIQNANKLIVKLVQRVAFPSELSALKNSGTIDKNSSLAPLNVFLDSEDIIRVGGQGYKMQN